MRLARILGLVLGGGLALGGMAQSANANTLFLPALGNPDVAGVFSTVSYTAATDQFVADGVSFLITPPGAPMGIDLSGTSTYHVEATIDDSGNATAGVLDIWFDDGSGAVEYFHSTSLVQFGSGPISTFEFLFNNVTGAGSAFGTTVGVRVAAVGDPLSPIANDPVYTADFSGSGLGDAAVVAAVPVPAALQGGLVLLIALGATAVIRRVRAA